MGYASEASQVSPYVSLKLRREDWDREFTAKIIAESGV